MPGEGGWVSDELTFVFMREPEAEQKSVRVVQDALMAVARPLHRWVLPSQMRVAKRNAAAVLGCFLLEPRAKQSDADRCLDTAKPLSYL